jgi:hypothetical protein
MKKLKTFLIIIGLELEAAIGLYLIYRIGMWAQ